MKILQIWPVLYEGSAKSVTVVQNAPQLVQHLTFKGFFGQLLAKRH